MNRDHTDYAATLTAVSTCIATRIPFLLWGEPGAGKTAVVESARESGFHVETLICSHYEPSDFAGLPIVNGNNVTLAPPGWAVRTSRAEGPALIFLDELTTASPAVQAAALRPLTHHQVGELTLPATVSFGAAANPADVAAAGWELATPTANRFVHLDWSMPTDVFAESLVTGDWPSLDVPILDAGYPGAMMHQRALVAAYLRIRGSQVSAIPKGAASRGRAFPTPRTWDYLARLLAACPSDATARRLLVHGTIGAPTGHEYLTWLSSLDLPDPEALISDPTGPHLDGLRADRVHVTLQGMLAAVSNHSTPDRWTAAVQACVTAADRAGLGSLTRFSGHLFWAMIARGGSLRDACTEAAGVPASCPGPGRAG